MSALGLETILVSYVVDSVHLAIRAGVGELATDGDGLIFRASVLKSTLLLGRDTVASLVTGK